MKNKYFQYHLQITYQSGFNIWLFLGIDGIMQQVAMQQDSQMHKVADDHSPSVVSSLLDNVNLPTSL